MCSFVPLISVGVLHVDPPSLDFEKTIGLWQYPPLQLKSKSVHVTYTLSLNGLLGNVSAAISCLSSESATLSKLVRIGIAVADSGGLNDGEHEPAPGVCIAEPLRHEFDFYTNTQPIP